MVLMKGKFLLLELKLLNSSSCHTGFFGLKNKKKKKRQRESKDLVAPEIGVSIGPSPSLPLDLLWCSDKVCLGLLHTGANVAIIVKGQWPKPSLAQEPPLGWQAVEPSLMLQSSAVPGTSPKGKTALVQPCKSLGKRPIMRVGFFIR